MRIRAAGWVLIAVAGILVTLAILAAIASRSEPLRKLVVATLEDRLNSDVELQSFSVDAYPSVTIQGAGLVIRLRGAGDVPPLIQIKSFTVYCGILDLVQRPRHFKHVLLEGLVINIPPGGLKGENNPIGDAAKDVQVDGGANGDKGSVRSPIIVDHLQADGALLRIIPRRQGKNPKEFAIHLLEMRSLGFAEKMPFNATLTNPVPKGEIQTTGSFGPWQKGDPATTPLDGHYVFDKADLNTIKGIGGILNSKGEFNGTIERIAVKGTTHTPDFHLDVSGQRVPLDTTFQAVVDGTDGDTYLENVDARFLRTSLTAKGAVEGTKGVKGRTVRLHVRIHEGRLEDLIKLSTKSTKPPIVGRIALHTDFLLPPGENDVIERLRLTGEFDVGAATFTDPAVQQKLKGMSARARGMDPADEKAGNVVSNLKGEFKLGKAVLSLPSFTFSLPGADVQLAGTFALKSEEINFDGTLRMQATISQAAGGGAKSFFLKLIDPLFRKKGAGALIPIRVRGTVEDPKYGLDVGRVFKGK
jgi:hypothetical protein